MMAIQDFNRAAGTLNRSHSGGAWIEKTGIRGRECAYPFYAYFVSISPLHLIQNGPNPKCLSAKDIYGALHISRALFLLNSRQPKNRKMMRLICVPSTNRVSQRKVFFESPAMRVFSRITGLLKSEKWVWGQKDGGDGEGVESSNESKAKLDGVLGRDV